MIKRIHHHKWIRPRYSSVLLEIDPVEDDSFVEISINGREPSMTPKNVSVSAATGAAGPFDLLVESLEMIDVAMCFKVPLLSCNRFVRIDFFGTMIPVSGTVKHQVYVTVNATHQMISNSNCRTSVTAEGSGNENTSTGTIKGVYEDRPAKHQSNTQLREVASTYCQAYAVSELRTEVRNSTERLAAAEQRLEDERKEISSSMSSVQSKLDEEHARQVHRSGLFHSERNRLIQSLRRNLRTPDVRALNPPLAAVSSQQLN